MIYAKLLLFFVQDFVEELAEKDKKLLTLVEMGFTTKEAASAIERCGNSFIWLKCCSYFTKFLPDI